MCQDSISNWTAATPHLNHQKKNYFLELECHNGTIC